MQVRRDPTRKSHGEAQSGQREDRHGAHVVDGAEGDAEQWIDVRGECAVGEVAAVSEVGQRPVLRLATRGEGMSGNQHRRHECGGEQIRGHRERRDHEKHASAANAAARVLGRVVRLPTHQRHRHQREFEAAQTQRQIREQRHARGEEAAPTIDNLWRSRRLPATVPHVRPPVLQQVRVAAEIQCPAAHDRERQPQIDHHRGHRDAHEVPRVPLEEGQPADRGENQHDQRDHHLAVPEFLGVRLKQRRQRLPDAFAFERRPVESLLPLRYRVVNHVLGGVRGREGTREHEVHRAERQQHEHEQLAEPTGNHAFEQCRRTATVRRPAGDVPVHGQRDQERRRGHEYGRQGGQPTRRAERDRRLIRQRAEVIQPDDAQHPRPRGPVTRRVGRRRITGGWVDRFA